MTRSGFREFSPLLMVSALAVTTLLTSCSSGGSGTTGGGGTPPPATYSIGGTVSGLAAGDTLSIMDNGGDVLAVTANGTFTFATKLNSGSAYSVTVSAQPASPAQGCAVSNGSGTATADVTSVTVTCTTGAYTLGGTISGLAASGLVLAESTQTVSPASGATSFTFPKTLTSGDTYSVTIQTQPSGEGCSLANGSGKVGSSNITNLTVTCGAAAEVVLYNFKGGTSDGGYYTTAGTLMSHAGLIMDSSGNLYGTTQFGGTDNLGTVFKLTKGSGGGFTESVLYSFLGGASDGSWPIASLIIDSNGNLYGTTLVGGTGGCTISGEPAGCGTVFKLTRTSGGSYTESLLYSFQGGASDGAAPSAGLILDSSGNLYGTTGDGGTGSCTNPLQPAGCGTVFKLAADSNGSYTESVLYSFQGGIPDGDEPQAGLIMDSSGNLYGTTASGGSQSCNNFIGCGTVFKLAPGSNGSYTESLLYTFRGEPTDGSAPSSIIVDSGGNLFGTTFSGGTSSYSGGTVFKLTKGSDGSYTESLLIGQGPVPEPGLIMDSGGNMYGSTEEGGTYGYGSVVKLVPGNGGSYTESALYSFQSGTSDGDMPFAGVIMDSNGNLFGTTVMGGASDQGMVFEIVQ